jgi:hypothetical protein
MNKEEKRQYYRDWYLKNKDKQQSRIKKNSQATRLKLRVWLKNLKQSLSCSKCGENHPACLQFHHKDRTSKSFEISNATRGYSIKRIEEEISKCEVLCANCHAKLHYEETRYDPFQ